MAGIKWQDADDIAELGRRIQVYDEPEKQRFLHIREKLKRRLKGRQYAGGDQLDGEVGTNDVLEFVANLEPLLGSQLPDTEVYTDKGGAAYGAARGLHHALRQWMVESGYQKEIKKSANEYAMGYMVRARGIGPRSGYEDEGIEWPWSELVPVERFGWDMRADCFKSAEYAYQVMREFPHDLLETARADNEGLSEGDPGYWDIEAIERIGKDIEDDGKLSYYVIYLPRADASKVLPPGAKHPERYRGVQLYVAANANGKPEWEKIRNATAHYGSNPYTVVGMQRIPDQSMDVTVLALTIDQADNFNAVVSSNTKSSKEYRRIGVVGRKKLAEMIRSSQHRHMYYDPSFNKEEYIDLEIGGVSEQTLVQEQRLEEIYHRAIGLTDADRGALSPGAKATDIAIASSASQGRRGGQVDTFHAGIKEDLEGILELIYYTDTVVVDLGPEAAEEGGSAAPVFFGGDFDKEQIVRYYKKHHPDVEIRAEDLEEGEDVPLTDLQLRLTAGSMGRKPKAERMADAEYEAVEMERTSTFLITHPEIDAKKYVRHRAKRTGFVEMPDFFDYAWVEFMRGMMVQGQSQGMPPAQGSDRAGTLKTGPETMVMPSSGRPGQLQPQNSVGPEGGAGATGMRQGATASTLGGL